MTVLHTPEDVLKALGDSALSANPLDELARRGFTMSQQLDHQMRTALAAQKPVHIPRHFLPDGVTRRITFQQPAVAPAAPPPGTFDVVLGLRVSAANSFTQALWESGTIPHRLDLQQLLSPSDLSTLESLFLLDKPGGHLAQIHILAGPTVSTVRNGSPSLVATVHFRLDFTRVILAGGRRISQLVTTAEGALQLTATLTAKVTFAPGDPGRTTIALGITPDTDPTAADSPHLIIDPASPVQLKVPVPTGQTDLAAKLIQDAIAKQFAGDLGLAHIGPIFFPIGHLDLRQIAVSTVDDVLLVGVQTVQGGQTTLGDPSTLKNLMPDPNKNIFVQIQSGLADGLIKAAQADGSLTSYAKQDHSNAEINQASAWFQDNAVVVKLDGTLVDECPFKIDLDFTLTRTVSIRLLGTSIEIDENDDQGILKASNIPCLLATVGLAGITVFEFALMEILAHTVWPGIFGFLTNNPGKFLVDEVIQGVKSLFADNNPPLFDISVNIPGTDYFPTLGDGLIRLQDGALFMAAQTGVLIDEVDTFIYARFLVQDGNAVIDTRPLTGVRVGLMDQDAPPPPGDDAVVVVPPDRTIGDNTAHYSFVPGSDEVLAQGITDLDGIVRFELTKGKLRTSAGSIKRVIQNKKTGIDPDKTTFTPVDEEKPDLYFRVTMPDGSLLDTRHMLGGFLENFTSGRVGYIERPLTFTLGASGGVTTA